MRSLGLQNSLTCEGVLQSARSIEAAFATPVPSIGGVYAAAVTDGGRSAATAIAAREAAVSRSRKLLNFVDHRADQLLLASGDTGRWFVDPSSFGADADGSDGGGGGVGGGKKSGEEARELSVSSGSGSEYGSESGGEGEELEEVERDREEQRARTKERREREREVEERNKARAAAADAMRSPPQNDFVEELATISWLPVHARAPNDLLPWKVWVS